MAQVKAPSGRSSTGSPDGFSVNKGSASKHGCDFEDFFENGALALHLVGEDGIILNANKAELELLGYPAEEYIGRPIADFHADSEVIQDILSRLKNGENL